MAPLVLAVAAILAASPPPAVYTSTRCVTDIAIAKDGAVWVGTTGGVLLRGADGVWRKFTAADGLPSSEVRGFVLQGASVVAVFPTASARWDGRAWHAEAAPRPLPRAAAPPTQTCATEWQGKWVVASPTGLQVLRTGRDAHPARDAAGSGTGRDAHPTGGARSGRETIPLPPSKGSHVSAMAPRGGVLLAAMYGDGLWEWNGAAWRSAKPVVPVGAREITALASTGSTLWLGTRRAGVWQWDGERWSQHLQPDEPFDHNVQSLAEFDGRLYASTLEDGLVVCDGGQWQHVAPPTISSVAPRQMAEFEGALYVRHGHGKVDRLAGGVWQSDVFASLPRRQVNALAVCGHRLFAAQWGGWSEFDWTRWTHRLDLPELQGVQTTAILATERAVWLGTQGKGIAEVDRENGAIRWHDLRGGLTDDWITCLAESGGTLWVGTFVGGLFSLGGGKWSALPGAEGQNVTAIVADGIGGVTYATRRGVWHVAAGARSARPPLLEGECQALGLGREGLWVGTRTGLYLVACTAAEAR